MTNPVEPFRSILRNVWRKALPLVLTAALVMIAHPAHAQTFTVLHTFTAGGDGATPYSGLTRDRAGNLYGTTYTGGSGAHGGVFKLSSSGSGWTLNPLYAFRDSDGSKPLARVIFGPDGALYGTTSEGGDLLCNGFDGCGTVFRLAPQPTTCRTVLCPWNETVLAAFQGPPDALYPGYGDLTFDGNGNLYGTTINGGNTFLCNDSSCGTIYKLAHSGGQWSESLLYQFGLDNNNGFQPYPGVIFDNAGNLYGAATYGGGAVFQLSQDGTRQDLYTFFDSMRDGTVPIGGLIFDADGNIYGTTSAYGPNNGGTVFQLVQSGGQWNLNTLYAFTYSGTLGPTPPGPVSTLVMDAGGNLYGTTVLDGAFNQGSVFKLTPSGGGWTLTTLHDFSGGTDGGKPWGQLIFDGSGNIYGTASSGGANNWGTVWEITP